MKKVMIALAMLVLAFLMIQVVPAGGTCCVAGTSGGCSYGTSIYKTGDYCDSVEYKDGKWVVKTQEPAPVQTSDPTAGNPATPYENEDEYIEKEQARLDFEYQKILASVCGTTIISGGACTSVQHTSDEWMSINNQIAKWKTDYAAWKAVYDKLANEAKAFESIAGVKVELSHVNWIQTVPLKIGIAEKAATSAFASIPKTSTTTASTSSIAAKAPATATPVTTKTGRVISPKSTNGYPNLGYLDYYGASELSFTDGGVYLVSSDGQSLFDGFGIFQGQTDYLPPINPAISKTSGKQADKTGDYDAKVTGAEGLADVKVDKFTDEEGEKINVSITPKEDAPVGVQEINLEIEQDGETIANIPLIADIQPSESPAPKTNTAFKVSGMIISFLAAAAAITIGFMKQKALSQVAPAA